MKISMFTGSWQTELVSPESQGRAPSCHLSRLHPPTERLARGQGWWDGSFLPPWGSCLAPKSWGTDMVLNGTFWMVPFHLNGTFWITLCPEGNLPSIQKVQKTRFINEHSGGWVFQEKKKKGYCQVIQLTFAFFLLYYSVFWVSYGTC